MLRVQGLLNKQNRRFSNAFLVLEILIQISRICVPARSVYSKPVFGQMMALCREGYKSLSK